MKAHELSAHVHHEDADDEEHNKAGERRTRWVVAIAAVMMVGELTVGWITGSMALTADGWHMGTHVGALGLTLVAYWYARTRAGTDTFSFGTGKVYALAGYTSGVLLAMVALLMAVESIEHLIHPDDIKYDEALAVASLGLVVNLVSVWLLSKGHHNRHSHGHSHGHSHDRAHSHDGHDHDGHDHAASDHAHAKPKPQPGTLDFNMRAAFIHVAADAMTSVMAIVALALGKWQGWWFLDPTMGIIGGVVIVWWRSRCAVRRAVSCSTWSARRNTSVRSASGSRRSTTFVSPTCTCGSSARAGAARSFRSCRRHRATWSSIARPCSARSRSRT
jgi:cation diffusion facilitator family transporter